MKTTTELGGWELVWTHLDGEAVDGRATTLALRKAEEDVRDRLRLETLAEDVVVAAVRKLFRAAGCDPTRYRPSSEALIRRVLKGEELPAIHPLVDLNNALSITLHVPACILAAGVVEPPFVLRAGRPGETMASLRGAFPLEGKPLLEDRGGPFSTPITDSERVKVRPETTSAVLVLYLPAGLGLGGVAADSLRSLSRVTGLRWREGAATAAAGD